MIEKIKTMGDLFPYCLTIVDVMQKGHPCIYANNKFSDNTGYDAQEAIGKNLSFLQGKLSDPSTCAFMLKCINEGKACIQDIFNYKKDGTIFLNRLLLLPLKSKGNLFYIGIQNDLTQKKRILYSNENLKNVSDIEIKHFVNNALSIAINGHSLLLKSNGEDVNLESTWEQFQDSLVRINDFALNTEFISEFENFKYI